MICNKESVIEERTARHIPDSDALTDGATSSLKYQNLDYSQTKYCIQKRITRSGSVVKLYQNMTSNSKICKFLPALGISLAKGNFSYVRKRYSTSCNGTIVHRVVMVDNGLRIAEIATVHVAYKAIHGKSQALFHASCISIRNASKFYYPI